jgi:hypothetical protein
VLESSACVVLGRLRVGAAGVFLELILRAMGVAVTVT